MNLDEIIQQHTNALPSHLQAEVFDFILFLEHKQANNPAVSTIERKIRLKQALEKAAALDIFAGIDGVTWQKEQRQDRAFGYDE